MDYKIIRSKRRTLCIQIANNEVVVRSPLLLPKKYIEAFVRDKELWINKTLAKIETKTILEPNKIFYLGRKYELKFGSCDRIDEGVIELKTIGQTKLEKKKTLEKFLKQESTKLVKAYLRQYQEFNFGEVKFSYYLSKWGSCSPCNDLTFNIKLAMCPMEVIEYVVVHELCHTRVKNHSQRFWREVAAILPDHKKYRKWLRDHRWYL